MHTSIQKTCFHEASHAVVAHHFGVAVGRLTAAEGKGGMTYHGETDEVTDLRICVAGQLGEERLTGEPFDLPAYDSPKSDLASTRSILARIAAVCPDTDLTELLSAIVTQTRHTVDAEWPKICYLAARLEQAGELKGQELKDILAGKDHAPQNVRVYFVERNPDTTTYPTKAALDRAHATVLEHHRKQHQVRDARGESWDWIDPDHLARQQAAKLRMPPPKRGKWSRRPSKEGPDYSTKHGLPPGIVTK